MKNITMSDLTVTNVLVCTLWSDVELSSRIKSVSYVLTGGGGVEVGVGGHAVAGHVNQMNS